MPLYLKERFQAYTFLWQPLSYCLLYFVQNLSAGLKGIQDRTFADFYLKLGHELGKVELESPVPRLVSHASGTVLEIGPGSGNQFPRFDRTKVDHIYGVEPNEILYRALKDSIIAENGLSDEYTIIHAGMENDVALKVHGLTAGTIDSILSVQVLCSVKDTDKAARQIYRLLKPGGQFLFWEHHVSDDVVTSFVQGLWNTIWTPLVGGCSLNRDIERALLKAGDWEIIEMGDDDKQPWRTMPRVWGRFVKKG